MTWTENHPRYTATASSSTDCDRNFNTLELDVATEDVEKRELLGGDTLLAHRRARSRRDRFTQFCWRGFFVSFNLILLILSLTSLYHTEKLKRDIDRNKDN